MRGGASHIGVCQQFTAYLPFMSPTSERRDDRYPVETVSSHAGHDRQQSLHSSHARSSAEGSATGRELTADRAAIGQEQTLGLVLETDLGP